MLCQFMQLDLSLHINYKLHLCVSTKKRNKNLQKQIKKLRIHKKKIIKKKDWIILKKKNKKNKTQKMKKI